MSEETTPVLIVKKPLFKNIAFFGDAGVTEETETYQTAFEAAKFVSQKGYTIVNGGGPGVMVAATKGAQAVKGETLTVTFYPKDAPGFEGRYVGNIPSQEIKTHNYIERMFKLMEHADLFVIFKGGSGTISEFGTAWVLGKLYYGHHKPFILFGDFWRPIIEVLKENMLIDEQELDCFVIVENKEELTDAIDHLEWKMSQVDHAKCEVCDEQAFMT